MHAKPPSYTRVVNLHLDLQGTVRSYLDAITDQWLLTAPLANPAMLEMFRDRDHPPQRDLVPWAGEFAGKYLTAAVQVLRVTNDMRLRHYLGKFVDRLLSFQDEDGYLGPWTNTHHLSNFDPNQGEEGMVTWDSWGHYHIMVGLLLWYEETENMQVLHAVERIGDLMCEVYLGKVRKRLVDTGMTEMNLAPVHSLCLLYQKTGVQRYLDLAVQIVGEFSIQDVGGALAGDYLEQALAGVEFYQMPKPRWESLHPIMGLVELYWLTGQDKYRQAYEHIWWSIVQSDRHNTGGFSSGEQASGNPYDRGPIETCCTIAWIALSVEMLKLTGNSIVADEIELSTVNSGLGMHSPTGRWATYNTPMDGVRRASAHSIVFQAREGSPELNCCSVNSPRGLGMISDWGIMHSNNSLILNYYGPCIVEITAESGDNITITQETDYPISGRITMRIEPACETEFTLKLRIPYWSVKTELHLNDCRMPDVMPGHYYRIQRIWRKGDTIDLYLDMTLHYWRGEKECAGLTSVYRGPILLAFDHRYNLHLVNGELPVVRNIDEWHPEKYFLVDMPVLDAQTMLEHEVVWEEWHAPWMLFQFGTASGGVVHLCDYASAGVVGTPYRSWLRIDNAPDPIGFTRDNPLRSCRTTNVSPTN